MCPSKESPETVTPNFGVHLATLEPGQKEAALRRHLLDLEDEVSSGRMTEALARTYLWAAIADDIKAPFLDRWWKRPEAGLSAAHLSELEKAGVLPPGILTPSAWGVPLTEAGPEDVIHIGGNNGESKSMGPPTKGNR